MPLTASQLADYAEQALQSETDGRIEAMDVVNQAGHYLVTLHQWSWLGPNSTGLDLIKDQPFVDLPDDFARMQGIEPTDSLTREVIWVDQAELERHRQDLVISVWDHYVALEQQPQPDTDSAMPSVRLAIWPTPNSTDRNALRLIYEATWRHLNESHQVANVPEWINPLLIELVRTFARGYMDDQRGGAGLPQRLENLENSRFLERFKARDGSQQWNLGELEGGAVSSHERIVYRPYTTISRE